MALDRLSRHRSGIITAAAVGAVVAVVGGIAVTSGGYTAQRVDLGDAAVWVANDDEQAIGRANTAALELNSLVETGGSDIELVQQGSVVLVLDPESASVDIVDATTSTLVAEPVPMPPAGKLALAGSQAVVSADGDVWTMPTDDFAEFDPTVEPGLSFGEGTQISVDPAGRLFAYTPSTSSVAEVDADDVETVLQEWEIEPTSEDADIQITSAGGDWAVLDVDARTLTMESGRVDLTGFIAPGDDPVLQQPSESGDEILVASRKGLIAVGVDDRVPRRIVKDRSGAPAAPVVHEGCVHAAWGGGSAWRSCAPADDRLKGLNGLSGAAAGLEFLANGRTLVLNDPDSGATWAASADYELINNWEKLKEIQPNEKEEERNDPDREPTVEKAQENPVAEDDEFGARPERSTLLPVILNDYDANGDVLVVSPIVDDLPSWATLDVVSDNQQLQLTLGAEAAGTIAFDYIADDGRGGTAQAHVEVTVKAPAENSPPKQQRPNRASVEAGGRVSTAVLGDWVDPDGDPFFLRQAAVDLPERISFTAEGVVVFDAATQTGDRSVALTVSDGRDEATDTLDVAVRAPGDVPLIADPFVALATAGEEISIEPLRHVRGGTGQVTLSAVPAKPDVMITPDFDGGIVRFTSETVKTHYLEYTVTDGAGDSATGTVRVDVSAPPDRDTTPITVPHTAYLRTEQTVDVDVLATDIDPTGGVLVVTAVDPDLLSAGARVEIVEHRLLRVSLTRPLPSGSMAFGYKVSNGLAEADGEVTLIEVPAPAAAQPPVAAPDVISVRTGDVIDIPVLVNDEHPDALPFTLAPDLVVEPDGGLLFAAEDRLRYFAPQEAGEFEATYRIEASDGQNATATVTITVSEPDAETNTAPVPATVTARVISGETVRVPIPLGGVDPDGDSVQLLGQSSNPQRGVVVETGPDWLEYQAGEYSAGADQFEYSVVDALGKSATGTVRLGIAERNTGPQAPLAVEDVITVRPDRTISVRVLENDSDPAGGVLSLTSIEPLTGVADARIVDDHVEVAIPDGEGEYSFTYTIENEQLGRAQSFLSIEARTDAELARPEASDTVLGLSDILGEERIDVPVLENVFLADGDPDDLGLALVEGFGSGAVVRPDGTIRVEVEDRRRIVPFVVSHPEDPTITAHAFIWIPGRDDALPQLRKDAPQVEVRSGEEVELELEDFVIAASGRPVTITDEASVRAAHGDGSSLIVDDDTLRFRSEEGYFGPASLSFTVTDGSSADDPDARTGTIVIPIDVRPLKNQPPKFEGGVIDLEPGQSRTLDLQKLTIYPYDDAADQLEYRVVPPSAEGFDVSLDGDKDEITIRAATGTRSDTRSAVSIEVEDASGDGTGGRIELRVVPSTKPIAQPAPDFAVVKRGSTTSIDVLANDEATNPFPDTPLRVVGEPDIGVLPRGVTVVPSASGATLAVTVAADAEPVNTTVQYQVADATNDRSRYAWGTVTISVQDRPDPVTGAHVTGFGDGTLDVAFGAGGFNNSPITGYEIAMVGPGSGEVISSSTCEATTCTVATPGNGQANGVIVRIRAKNGIGFSDPVNAPGPIWSDVIPSAPSGLRALPRDGRLRIEWSPVSSGSGSAVRSYVVTVAGAANEVSAAAACTASVCVADSQGLENGSRVPVSVSARNEAYPALASWTESTTTGTPFGAPVAGSIGVNADAAAAAVTVSWDPFGSNGDAIGGYYVQRLVDGASGVPSGPQACSVTTPAPGSVIAPSSGGTVAETVPVSADTTSLRFSGTDAESTRYSFVVWGYNRAGCVSTEVAGTVVRPAPGAVTDVQSGMGYFNSTTWDRYISSVDVSAPRMEIVAVDAGGSQIPGSIRSFPGTGWLREVFSNPDRFAFGQTARFQVRGCTPWGSCGPWSQVIPAGDSPSLTFALDKVWDTATQTWSWTTPPNNSGLPATFRCGFVGGPPNGQNAQSATTCRVNNAPAGEIVWLDVEVAGVSVRYTARS